MINKIGNENNSLSFYNKVMSKLSRGQKGEEIVSDILNSIKEYHYLLNNVTFKNKRSEMTHQIDHILIHPHGVFVIETLSVIIQVVWMYLFHKKLFLMTPLHHHFEKLGWMEQDIVKLFWVVGLILTMAGIYYGVWL